MIYKYYCDGAATMRKVNGEYVREMGGYAWASVDTENDKILKWNSAQVSNTTNNEMELSAIHNALRHHGCPEGSNIVEIYSDSAYCVNIFTQWIKNWEANGWTRGKKREPIENLGIIKSIWEMVKKLSEGFSEVRFIKVAGHSGDKYNEIVDKLAVEAKEGKGFIGPVSSRYLDEYIYPEEVFFFNTSIME